jgi:hypothetical protein
MTSAFERLANKAKDIFLGGPDNWEERLQGIIEMTSPEGTTFEAKWRGDPRRHDKKLAIFYYPKVKGNVVQDLDINSTIWTLTFYFDGENNDVQASQFFEATKQSGTWDVTHPVHGFVELQLMEIEEVDNPTESGNITEFVGTWIEPIDPDLLVSTRELADTVGSQSDALDESALEQFANKVSTATEAARNGIEKGVNGVENISDAILDPISQISDEVFLTQNAIRDAIRDTMNATVLRTRSLAGEIQALHTNPARVPRDAKEQTKSYSNVIESLGQGLASTSGPQIGTAEINNTLVVELAMSAAVSGLATAVLNNISTVKTRTQALGLITDVSNAFENLTTLLDGIQTLTGGAVGIGGPTTIGKQYFSQSESYTNMLLLASVLSQYLLVFSFELSIERRYTLDVPTAPLTIAIQQYGDADEGLDFLIETNQLKGDDIWVLPAGREVVVYG